MGRGTSRTLKNLLADSLGLRFQDETEGCVTQMTLKVLSAQSSESHLLAVCHNITSSRFILHQGHFAEILARPFGQHFALGRTSGGLAITSHQDSARLDNVKGIASITLA